MTASNRPDLVQKLTDGIAQLTTTDDWQRFLDYQSRFHSYSFSNVLLIAAQYPTASQVAGYRAWQRMNRFVRKGEKGIFILAPLVYKRTEAEAGDEECVIQGWKYVPVFDLAQTDGEELPSICHHLTGDDPTGVYYQLLTVAKSIGFTVEDAEIGGGAVGDCRHDLRRIRVEMSNSPVQRVKTLAHEIAHAMLHETFDDRRLAELEAESTAYIVCQAMGLESSDYSFGYVASWAGNGIKAIAGIKASGQRIQRAAATILRSLRNDDEIAA